MMDWKTVLVPVSLAVTMIIGLALLPTVSEYVGAINWSEAGAGTNFDGVNLSFVPLIVVLFYTLIVIVGPIVGGVSYFRGGRK